MPRIVLAACLLAPLAAGEAELINPTTREYRQEALRVPAALAAAPVAVDGVPPAQEVIAGERWIVADFAPGQRRRVAPAAGTVAEAAPLVQVVRDGDAWVLDNGVVAVRVPAEAGAAMPAPVLGIRAKDGPWVGAGRWAGRPPATVTSTVVGRGQVLGRVALRYADGEAWAETTVSLGPGWSHAEIAERHRMRPGDGWRFDLAAGWQPAVGSSRPFASGFMGGDAPAPPPDRPLTAPGGQPWQDPALFITLIPRWNQHCKDGWFFAAADGERMAGCMPVRASQWDWPHDNAIDVRVRGEGGQAELVLPTWRGERRWLLIAGPRAALERPADAKAADPARAYMARYALEALDVLNREYILEWPGMPLAWRGMWPFDQAINPTGGMRSRAKQLRAKPPAAGDGGLLTNTQVLFHADTYGTYARRWSPQNPNFFTDFITVPVLQAIGLKQHPRFAELRALAQAAVEEDLRHSVTLPGGAGQECPGYLGHAIEGWEAIGEHCATHLGFDPRTSPRFIAAKEFLRRISQPDGAIRRDLPMGDTHPGKDGPKPVDVPAAEAAGWPSQEFPGFGAIMRHRPGTPQETYLAFKGGPNRGHYHGDQLSIHLCLGAKPTAVDHHCSYKPRAGQEHMHNRLSFSTAEMPSANMDGYERMLAWKSDAVADIAVAQVESPRLRAVAELPPERWHQTWPQRALAKPLIYRRTAILLKGAAADGRDAIVLRDQWTAGERLTATFNLHVRAETLVEQAGVASFGAALVAHRLLPAEARFASLPWRHENGGGEATQGARWSADGESGEFVTVLLAGDDKTAVSYADGVVRIGAATVRLAGFHPDLVYEQDKPISAVQIATPAGGTGLLYDEMSLTRSQGDIGLFVPDIGYPFGPIPEWLVAQRPD